MTALPSHWNAQLSTDHVIHEMYYMNSQQLINLLLLIIIEWLYKTHMHECSTMNSYTVIQQVSKVVPTTP